MHDARTLIELGDEAVRRLARRGYTLDLAGLEALSARRNASISRGDELRAESKRVAQEVGRAAKESGGQSPEVEKLKGRARELKDEIREAEEAVDSAEAELRRVLLTVPNLPDDETPDGDSDEDAVEVRRWGAPPEFTFETKDHVDLGEAMGILDFGRAAKLAGARFSVARGPGAVLERALASLFLALHTGRHGYTEFSVPFLVTPETMTGTGQLPKFEEDLFRTGTDDRSLYLIPTAEVPLTNLHAGEMLDAGSLPLAYTAWTPCFRSEAGSYGRDTRGILRLHQFSKVEMVRFCAAEESGTELELMVSHAEACLQALGLAYRVIRLAAGDMGFAAQMTYDVEVWLPSQGTFREISSCSDCGTFQSRRAGIRAKDPQGGRQAVATLNGSGLPIGRAMAAVLEQFQDADGSVSIPEVLHPYTGFRRIRADGTTE
ncbi:serine--tRNA ligase [Actinomycetospora endophytica]|uniref:Serine--tRNA ligase n=1 Tax=Actinomycetospora endophytica TaxID=2291215 RepID=A0ABS8P855_9PSEU|nr:serine--tRNA ligase [Actinomycetospora endophytica]MCD2193224.1 serine--tRNA ligase [Actinomycetospora endophytica]